MLRRFITLLCFGFIAALQTANADEPLPPVAQWFPQDAILTLEISKTTDLLDLVLSPILIKAVTSTPAYQNAASQTGFKEFQGVIQYLETILGIDWKSAVQKLLGKGVTLAFLPDEAFLLAIDAEDEDLLKQLHDTLLGFAKDDAIKKGEPDKVESKEYQGVTGWTLDGKEAHVIIGNRLLYSNKSKVLKDVLDRRAGLINQNLTENQVYQSAKKTVNADAALSIFLRLDILNKLPQMQKALAQNMNPLLALLLAEIPEAIQKSNWLSLALDVSEETLSLNASMDGMLSDTAGPMTFARPDKSNNGAPPILTVPRQIAGISFYRDLYKFYAAKDDLFPERTSGLIFFENMMGIFFTGRDLTEEVWKETKPEIRIVAAKQEYDPSIGIPGTQFPAFAVIFKLHNPQKFGEVVEEAWQKAIGLINFTRGQQAQPGLLIDRPVYNDIKITSTYFSSVQEEKKTNLDTRYNFQPTLARIDDNLIFSSTDQLAKDLIDSLKKEKEQSVESLKNTHSVVELDAVQISSILKTNRETMVRQNMVEKGISREDAETEFDLLTYVINYLGHASLNVGTQKAHTNAKLEIKLNLPNQ